MYYSLTNAQTSTTIRSESPASSYHDLEEDEVTGIDRHPIDPDEARTHFLSNGEKHTKSSSRVSSKRKSYRSASRRRRKDAQEISDEDEETLERKLARLRKEVVVLKQEFERKKIEIEDGTVYQAPEAEKDLEALTKVLENVESSAINGENGAANRLAKRLASAPRVRSTLESKVETDPAQQNGVNSMYTVTYAPSYLEDHTLSKVTDFDQRLRLIETSLGIDAIPLPTQDRSATKAVIPTLNVLDKQFSALSTSTDTSLDAISQKVRRLTQDAERLERTRKSAKAAREALSPSSNSARPASVSGEVKEAEFNEDAEQVSKINALYGTLSTIESLAPLLPSVLDRLRSLRSLHADAGTASQSLSKLERKQEEMKEELQGWREGLEKVEKAMVQGEQTMKGNTEMVDGWVKELERRMSNLGLKDRAISRQEGVAK